MKVFLQNKFQLLMPLSNPLQLHSQYNTVHFVICLVSISHIRICRRSMLHRPHNNNNMCRSVVVEVVLEDRQAPVDPVAVVDLVDLVAVATLADPVVSVVVDSVVVVCDRPDLVGDPVHPDLPDHQDHPDQGGAQALLDLARLAQLRRNGFPHLLGPLAHRVHFRSGNGFGLCRAGAESRGIAGKSAA